MYLTTQCEKIEDLFRGSSDTLILSCLQNIMGHIYADNPEKPTAAAAILGDFCFLAGQPSRAAVSFKPENYGKDFIILMPQSEDWFAWIEDYYGERAKKVTRYAMKQEKGIFHAEQLEKAVAALPGEYELTMIDESLFKRCGSLDWCKEFVAQYDSYELYCRHGLGVVIRNAAGEIVAGASSYSGYREGIEVEICTREDYRRRGLAYVSGAKLILECLKRDWYPSWDAQNKWSAALAEKLGYHYSHDYTAYEISDY